jgi:D-alanyl-D-alanine carboxypeptidase
MSKKTNVQAITHLNKYFKKVSQPSKDFSGVQALVFSPKLGLDWRFAEGTSKRAGALTVDQPFHVASVGKLFTATILFQLSEEGKIDLNAPIASVIGRGKLADLFVYGGIDYSDKVTFRQLISHTSGIADYFGGPVLSGETMEKLLETQSDKVWQPQELLDFSIEHQVAEFAPEAGYLYSDTGYVLLGMLIETIEGKAFEAVLEDRLFKPLQMAHSYMTMRSSPLSGDVKPIADLWLNGVEFGDKKALSVDWAGGGVISTLDDLMKFSVALHSGSLISEASQNRMFSDTNKSEQGIYTGDGGMTVRFKKFFPLLNLPLVRGHIGILSTHVFYDSTTDTHIVLNFGSTSKMVPSFKALIDILSVLKGIKS